jgi:hypothetical protein
MIVLAGGDRPYTPAEAVERARKAGTDTGAVLRETARQLVGKIGPGEPRMAQQPAERLEARIAGAIDPASPEIQKLARDVAWYAHGPALRRGFAMLADAIRAAREG